MAECGICGRMSAHLERRDRVVATRGQAYVLKGDEFFRCDHCGEFWYTDDQARASEAKLSALRRAAGGLLLPEEIRAVRRRLGVSLAKLEDALGLGRNTIIRWEKGTVLPSRTADRLLRLLDRDPTALDFLARLREAPSPTERRRSRSISG